MWLDINKIKVPRKLIDPGKDTSWWSATFSRVDQFVNISDEWMMDVAMEHFPGFDWEAFKAWDPKTPAEMLNARSFSEPVELRPGDYDVVAVCGDDAEAIYAVPIVVAAPARAPAFNPNWRQRSDSDSTTDSDTDLEVVMHSERMERKYPSKEPDTAPTPKQSWDNLFDNPPITECYFCCQKLTGTQDENMLHELKCNSLRTFPIFDQIATERQEMLRIPLPATTRQTNTTSGTKPLRKQVTCKGHPKRSETHGRGKRTSGPRQRIRTTVDKTRFTGSSKQSSSSLSR